MFTKYIIPTAALLVASAAMADTNKMIVNKSDGTKLTYDVNSINNGTFTSGELKVNGEKLADLSEITNISFIDQTTLPFTVTSPEGEITGAYESVPSVLRVVASAAGNPTQFAFGTVKAEAASELPAGEYGIYLALAPTALNAGGVADLSASKDEYTLKLYSYKDGQAVDSLTTVNSGEITYAWASTRKRLTLNINATFSDGTVLKSEFTGTPVDVESVDEIVPAKAYANEIVIVDASGTSSRTIALTGVTISTRTASSYNPRTLVFTFKNDDATYKKTTLEVIPDLIINKGDIDMATVTGDCYCLKASAIQLYAIDSGDYKNAPLNGVMNIKDLGDNNYEIFLQVTNTYKNPWGEGTAGTGENITIHWNGTVTE